MEQSDLGRSERRRDEGYANPEDRGTDEEGCNEEEGRGEEDREEEDNEKEQRDVGEQEESDQKGDFVASPLRSGGVDGERGTQVRSKCDYCFLSLLLLTILNYRHLLRTSTAVTNASVGSTLP